MSPRGLQKVFKAALKAMALAPFAGGLDAPAVGVDEDGARVAGTSVEEWRPAAHDASRAGEREAVGPLLAMGFPRGDGPVLDAEVDAAAADVD